MFKKKKKTLGVVISQWSYMLTIILQRFPSISLPMYELFPQIQISCIKQLLIR